MSGTASDEEIKNSFICKSDMHMKRRTSVTISPGLLVMIKYISFTGLRFMHCRMQQHMQSLNLASRSSVMLHYVNILTP